MMIDSFSLEGQHRFITKRHDSRCVLVVFPYVDPRREQVRASHLDVITSPQEKLTHFTCGFTVLSRLRHSRYTAPCRGSIDRAHLYCCEIVFTLCHLRYLREWRKTLD